MNETNVKTKGTVLSSVVLLTLIIIATYLIVNSFTITPSHAQIAVGAYVQNRQDNLDAVKQFEKEAGHHLDIIEWYQGWDNKDSSNYFETQWMENVRKHGSVPLVTWEPWFFKVDQNQKDFSLQAIIDGKYDSYITAWATASKKWNNPYYLRFGHEMNGTFYPWSIGTNGQTAEQYVAAWKHVHDIFTKIGATKVIWVWSVQAGNFDPKSYPGDNYVDWVGMDGYNFIQWDVWHSFTETIKPTYDHLPPNKPVMIAEFASDEKGGSKAQWILSGLTQEIKSLPRIKAVVWFNANKETDWRIESSASSTKAFFEAMRSNLYH